MELLDVCGNGHTDISVESTAINQCLLGIADILLEVLLTVKWENDNIHSRVTV